MNIDADSDKITLENVVLIISAKSIIAKPFKTKLKNEIFYYKDNKKFILEIEKYLESGKFYKCIKEESRKYFLQSNSFGNRDKLLHNALTQIKQ